MKTVNPYTFTYLDRSSDHNTNLLIGAINKILKALDILSHQLAEIEKELKESNT